MKDFRGMLKQAQEMQARLAKLQEEMAEKTVEASAGGGMVTVVANGRQEILSVRIEKEVVSPEEIDLLQDLVRAAVNEALSRSREMMAAEMAKITGGFIKPCPTPSRCAASSPCSPGSPASGKRRRRASRSTC
jgi:DNA-binding YbaB/EbfC family protein